MQRRTAIAAAIGVGLVSTAAFAFPWDIDMVDARFLRGFEWKMMSPPEGSVSANQYRGGYSKMTRMTPEGVAMTSPYQADLEQGKEMYDTYCGVCHGIDGAGGAPITDMSKRNRYPLPPAMLSGPASVSPIRSDGYLFLTIQQGGAIMPAYGSQMTDEEIWATVAYVRTFDNAQFKGAPQ